MNVIVGNISYWFCAAIAAIFVGGAVVVIAAQVGDSPVIAGTVSAVLAALVYGFGWSGRRLMTARH